MDLGLRRLLLIVLSIIGGIVLLPVMLFLISAGTGKAVTLESYGSDPTYIFLSVLPLALLVGLWLDYFMRTNLLPEDGGKVAAPAAAKGKRPAAAAETTEE